ncbi:MAG: PAS domain S-box protein [Ignavibacteriales bacterium]|nr:PAS domain S-box protein [Ignavibacteriales bacterium]
MLNKSLGNITSANVKEIINSDIELNPETIEELDTIAQLISDLQLTRDALRESEEKYRLLFSNVPLGILHFDSFGKITTCNDNFISIVDLAKDKIIGEQLIDVIDSHLVTAIENALAGTVGHYEGDIVSKISGKITPVRVNFAPIILEGGVINGGVGLFEDITERKQIERIFFHDIINTAGNLNNFIELIDPESIKNPETKQYLEIVASISNRIVDEIRTHKHLLTSDKSQTKLRITEIGSLDFFESICNYFNRADLLSSKTISIFPESENVYFESDETVLGRVLNNMLKNAIEASNENDTINLYCGLKNGMVTFSIHNSTHIPQNIQLHLFNRSVSTKGAGRGLGLYSMKYLTETYLKGTIAFNSSEAEGTTFTASYPLKIKNDS